MKRKTALRCPLMLPQLSELLGQEAQNHGRHSIEEANLVRALALNIQMICKTLTGIVARARGRVRRAPGQAWQRHVGEPLDSENGDRQRRERIVGSNAQQASCHFYFAGDSQNPARERSYSARQATRAPGEARAAYDVEGRESTKPSQGQPGARLGSHG